MKTPIIRIITIALVWLIISNNDCNVAIAKTKRTGTKTSTPSAQIPRLRALYWTYRPVSENIQFYNVYELISGQWTRLGSTTLNKFMLGYPPAGTTHVYSVTSVNAFGESTKCPPVTLVMPP
jgi:hypothetical protein